MWKEERPEIDDVEGIYRATAPVQGIVHNNLMETKRAKYGQIAIVTKPDPHLASRGANLKRDNKADEWVKNTYNAYMIPIGDIFNNGIKPGQHRDIVGNQAIIDYVAKKLMPLVLQGKLPVMINGNHDGVDGARNVEQGLAPMEQLYDKLTPYSIEEGRRLDGLVKHAKFAALTTFPLVTPDARRDKLPLTMYFTHGSGKGGTPASSVESEHEKANAQLNGESRDVEFSAHHHSNTNGRIISKRIIFDENGKPIGVRTENTLVVSESTLQEDAEYSKMAGLPPADSNVNIYIFSWAKNYAKGKNGDDRDYIVDVRIMPMFRKDSNEYTNFAARYMQEHLEPDRAKIRETIRRMSTKKIEARLRNQVTNYGTAKSIMSYLRNSPKTVINEESSTQKDYGRGK